MDWIKIKGKHVLYGGLTPSDKGIMLMIQVLTAELEREPLEIEILQLPGVGKRALDGLSERLRKRNASLTEIVRKVLEDVSEYTRNRESAKQRKKKSRSKEDNVTRDVTPISQGLLDKIRIDKIQKEQQAAQKESVVPPDAAAAFTEKLGEQVKAVSVGVMDSGGSIPVECQQTTNDDYLDIAIRVVWIRAQRGKKFDDPNAYAHSLANTYKMSPEEFARGMKTVADYELIQAYKAAEQQKALEKQAQAELDQAESDKKNREYLDLLEKYDELPEFDQKAIESFAVEAFRDDGNHYQPPAIKSLPMRPYFLEAFKAHMGVFE